MAISRLASGRAVVIHHTAGMERAVLDDIASGWVERRGVAGDEGDRVRGQSRDDRLPHGVVAPGDQLGRHQCQQQEQRQARSQPA